MVGRVLAKDELGVRFSLPAQEVCRLYNMAQIRGFHVKTVDNYGEYVHKRQEIRLTFVDLCLVIHVQYFK